MEALEGPDGLPAYTVRQSRRARRMSLRIDLRGELEIVVPRRYDLRRIPALVASKRGWIERTSRRIREQRGLIGPHCFELLPAGVELPAIGERWGVRYRPTRRAGVRLRELPPDFDGETGHLELSGDIEDQGSCKKRLRKWLGTRARLRLGPWLEEVSEEVGLPFSKVGFRGASTRWASCSGKKGISLNPKLLFLPRQLVRYVFLHELAHTARPDHSGSFWRVLERLEPQCRQLDREVRRAWSMVPLWTDR